MRSYSCFLNNVRHKHLCLLISALLLLGRDKTTFRAHGRITPQLPQQVQREGGEKVETRSMIGSSPPRCFRRCRSCKHCEAIQVPVLPRKKINGVAELKHNSFPTTFNFRDGREYESNYKPMSWKCKCGNVIFNP